MAIKFAKKSAPEDTAKSSGEEQKASSKSWLKTGSAAKQAMAYEEQKAEERKSEQGKLWRFFLKDGEEARITFLDGDLDEEGMLEIPMFYEHRIKVGGDWVNYPCTAERDQSQPCPICEKGDKPSLVGLMTIIDHREYTVKKGPNAGKVIKSTKRLFVCKRHTINQLNKLAAKRGGLRGCTFDASRSGEKEPGVGDMFDFVEKNAIKELSAKIGLSIEDLQPANYEEEIRYRTPEELIEIGVGKAHIGAGYENGVKGKLADEL